MPWTVRRLRTVLAALAVPAVAAGVLAVAATTSASVGADAVVGHPGLFPVPAGYADAVGVGVDSVSAGLPACPSASLCVAAGDVRKSATEVDAFVWTSAEPVRGGWTYHLLPVGRAVTAHVASVSCASATRCIASGSVSVPAVDGVGLQTRAVTWTATNPALSGSWTLADAAAAAPVGLDGSSAVAPDLHSAPAVPPLPAGATNGVVSDVACAPRAGCFAIGHYTAANGDPRSAIWTSADGSAWTFGLLPMPPGYAYLRTDSGTGARPAQCFGSGASLVCLISGRVLTATGDASYGLWASHTPADATSWRFVSLEQPAVGARVGTGAVAGRATCQSGYCFYANTGHGTANPYGDTYLWATSAPTGGSVWTLIRTPAARAPVPTTSPSATVPASRPVTVPRSHPVTVLAPRPVRRVKVRQVRGGKAKLTWVRPPASAARPRTGFRVYVNNRLKKTLTGTRVTLTRQHKGRKYAVKIVAYNRVGTATKKVRYRRSVK